MASSFSVNKGLEEPASGDYVNAWATPVNANWTAIDAALGGTTSISVTGISAPTTTLTLTQYRPPNIEFTGTLAANLNYQIPTGVGGVWSISNATTGAFNLVFSIASGNSLTLAVGRTLVISNGVTVSVAGAQPLTSQLIGQTIYPQTSTEQTLGIAPTIFIPVLRFDPVRYGATGSGDPADSNADTAGLNEAILRALADRGEVWLGDNRQYTVPAGTLAYTCSGNRGNFGLRIVGAGWNGTSINQLSGSSGALIAFNGATPTTAPNEAPMVMEGFTLNGSSPAGTGILLNGISYWTLRGIQLSGFGVGIQLLSALVGVIEGCQSGNNNFGLVAQRNGPTSSGCNSITIRDSQFNLNTTQGLYIASGTNWRLEQLDIEVNGTSGGLTTGGIRLVSTLGSEFGASTIKMENIHLEGNLGQPFLVDAGTTNLNLEISTLESLSGEGHRELLIKGGQTIKISNSISPGATGDVWDITCSELIMENCHISTLTDTGVSFPTYSNITTAAGHQYFGRADSFIGTLTNVTGTVAANIGIRQQGDSIWFTFPSGGLVGPSTTIAVPTITGLPARYTPAADRVLSSQIIDNSAGKAGSITIGANGIITINSFSGFTASNSKGMPAITLGPYFL